MTVLSQDTRSDDLNFHSSLSFNKRERERITKNRKHQEARRKAKEKGKSVVVAVDNTEDS